MGNKDKSENKLLQKEMDMMIYANEVLENFPRSERGNTYAKIVDCMDNILKLTIRANKRYYKKTTLQDLDIEIETLRYYFRICAEPQVRHISPGQLKVLSQMLKEIGRMVGGWIKAAKR